MDIKNDSVSPTSELIRRASCHVSLALAASVFVVTAFDIIQNSRSVANVQSWCETNGCIDSPKHFGSSQLTVPAAKVADAALVVKRWEPKILSALNARPAALPVPTPGARVDPALKPAKGGLK